MDAKKIINGLEQFANDLENDRPVMITRFYYDDDGNLVRERAPRKLGELSNDDMVAE